MFVVYIAGMYQQVLLIDAEADGVPADSGPATKLRVYCFVRRQQSRACASQLPRYPLLLYTQQ